MKSFTVARVVEEKQTVCLAISPFMPVCMASMRMACSSAAPSSSSKKSSAASETFDGFARSASWRSVRVFRCANVAAEKEEKLPVG